MSAARGSRAGRVAAYAVLIIAALTALFPLFWTVSTSVKDRVDSYANPPKFFNFAATWKNYRDLFGRPQFLRVYVNTVVITLASTVLCVVVGGVAAYALARHRRFHGRRPLEATLVLVRAMPGIVLIVPIYQLVTRFGLYDSRPTMVVIYATVNLPFSIWLMTSFLEQIPIEVEECARTDGAGRFHLFVFVIAPLALPGIAATMIFVALLNWNEFLLPVILAGNNAETLPVYISGFISNRTLDWGPMAAASSLAIVPIALLTVLIQRQLVSGLSSGAVKE
ncbi:MAG: carbohydrate ABC transporter permease [Acidimicrobiales bacterium]